MRELYAHGMPGRTWQDPEVSSVVMVMLMLQVDTVVLPPSAAHHARGPGQDDHYQVGLSLSLSSNINRVVYIQGVIINFYILNKRWGEMSKKCFLRNGKWVKGGGG